MMDNPLNWLFWSGAAMFAYGDIAGTVRYVAHLRRGARHMAAAALVQTMVSTFGLLVLWYVHHRYFAR